MRPLKRAGLLATVWAMWKMRHRLRDLTRGAARAENDDARAARLAATGVEGTATVLSVEDTGATMSNDPMVTLHVRIEPAGGEPAFEAQRTTFVSRIRVPRPGERFPVFHDPAKPAEWAFPVGTFGVTPPGRLRVLLRRPGA
ncbi:MAG TPA: DUF3592 domain-containing protein [Mycobacteriales bacterium]|nr:DUF3592 domain-containing protein [Mycobacteriales bacterium]